MDEYKILKEYEQAKQNGTLPEIPDDLDEKCKALIYEAFGTTRCRTFAKRIGSAIARAGVVVLIMLGLFTVTVLSVDAFRVPVLNFIMDKSGKFAAVTPDEIVQAENEYIDTIISRFNDYIPSGYTLIDCVNTGDKYSIAYQNAEMNTLRLTCAAEENIMLVDVEDTSFVSMDFGCHAAAFSEKKGYRLIWLDSKAEVVYTLFSDGMTEEAFWEFAYFLIN